MTLQTDNETGWDWYNKWENQGGWSWFSAQYINHACLGLLAATSLYQGRESCLPVFALSYGLFCSMDALDSVCVSQHFGDWWVIWNSNPNSARQNVRCVVIFNTVFKCFKGCVQLQELLVCVFVHLLSAQRLEYWSKYIWLWGCRFLWKHTVCC